MPDITLPIPNAMLEKDPLFRISFYFPIMNKSTLQQELRKQEWHNTILQES